MAGAERKICQDTAGVPKRGAREKGGGLGLCDFAAVERSAALCEAMECAELGAWAALR